jgi:xylulokinase
MPEPGAPRGAKPLLLVLDIGLTNCKAVAFRPDGAIVGRASVPYPTYRPAPDRVEQDPDEWWGAVCASVAALRAQVPDLATGVAGMGVTAHMHSVAAIDSRGVSLGRAIALGDRRAVSDAEALAAEIGVDEIYRCTGALLDPSMPAAELRWLRRHGDRRWTEARAFLGCKDFVRYRLTGRVLTEPIDACATSLYDIRKGAWSEDLARAVGLDEDRLPEVRPVTAGAGPLVPAAAEALGLPSGIPVVVGAGDDIEVLGNGLLEPGTRLEHIGTTGSILAVADHAAYDPDRALEVYPHAVDGLWVIGGSMTAAGAALSWAARVLGFETLHDALDAAAGSARSGSPAGAAAVPLFLPHLAGERIPVRDPMVRGAWVGMDINTDAPGLMRAACEGVAHALCSVLSRTERLVGARGPVSVVRNDADDPWWLNLRAAVYERSLAVLDSPEPTALGLMLVIACGIGIHPDLRTATQAVVRHAATVDPDPELARSMRARHAMFERLASALAPVWPAIAAG